jgi:hypothetical protein
MSDYQYIRKKFESSANPEHSVITVDELNETVRDSRRVSLKTLEWLSGKVEAMRRKFTAVSAGNHNEHSDHIKNKQNRQNPKLSMIDGDLIDICQKYQVCGANKYTWIGEPFESLVSDFGRLIRTDQIEIHHSHEEAPKGILLLPLSSNTSQSLLDFTEMGGFSLGRGIAKRDSRALSRTHCMIYLEDNRVFIKDCDSKTGTFVCGRLLGSSIPTEVDNFDIIQLGYGADSQDFVQSMIIFLSKWNHKEFASSIQHISSPTSTFSRTFSQQLGCSLQSPKSPTVKELISSPKLTQINSNSKKSSPVKDSYAFDDDMNDDDDRETIIFERPRFSVNQQENIKAIHSAPPRQQNQQIQQQNQQHQQSQSLIHDPHPQQEESMPSLLQSPLIKQSIPLEEASDFVSEQYSRPPVPKPRKTLKNLSKSAECLVEIEMSEFVDEKKSNEITSAASPSSGRVVKTLPIQAALAARKTSIAPQIVNIEVPNFLKIENMKIPSISPAVQVLKSSGIVKTETNSKFNLPFLRKRQERLEKYKRKAQFHTIVQGAQTRRFETFVDFGTGTSDISDGISCAKSGADSIKSVFNNFKSTWISESINQSSGTRLFLRPMNTSSKNHYVILHGEAESKFATLEMDLKTKFQLKAAFSIDDRIYKQLTGQELNPSDSLPLKALEQLSYFYPHLEIPSLLIQGAPDGDNSISLATSTNVQKIGKIVFESQSISWMRRLMNFAVDLDSSIVEVNSLLSDTIQSVALLYCLRYQIDY